MSQLEPDLEIDEEVFEPGESNSTVIRLSLTAALGGFLFGYDSAVINGAVTARSATSSDIEPRRARLRGGLRPARLRRRRLVGRPARRPLGPAAGHA